MVKVAAARRRNGATNLVLGRVVEHPKRWLEAFRLHDRQELHRGITRVNLIDAAAVQAARALHSEERPPEAVVTAIERG